jgi:Cu-Zn family superoxide dismutase
MKNAVLFSEKAFVSLAMACLLGASGCGGSATPPAETAAGSESAPQGEDDSDADRSLAEMYPTQRSEVSGTIVLRKADGGVLLKGRLNGLPAGTHALAVHEKGDCSAHDAKSVGGIFNPAGADPALGRLGDLTTKEPGKTEVEITVPGLEMSGPNSVVGKALVVHAWPYDPAAELEKVPYLACGVIRPR